MQLQPMQHAKLIGLSFIYWICWSHAASQGLPLPLQMWPGVGLLGRGNRAGWTEFTLAMVCIGLFYRPVPCFVNSGKMLRCDSGSDLAITSDEFWPSCAAAGGNSLCPSHVPYMCADAGCRQWPSLCAERGGLRLPCQPQAILQTEFILCCVAVLGVGLSGHFLKQQLSMLPKLAPAADEQLLLTNVGTALLFVPLCWYWNQLDLLLDLISYACDCGTIRDLSVLFVSHWLLEQAVLRYDGVEARSGEAVAQPDDGVSIPEKWLPVAVAPLAAIVCSVLAMRFGHEVALLGVLIALGTFGWKCWKRLSC